MKKLKAFTVFIVLAALLQAQPALAQNLMGTVVSGQPMPNGGTSTTGTTVPAGTSTGGTATGTRGQTTGTRNPAGGTVSQTTTLPTPTDIPLVPTLTQQTATTQPDTSTLVCDQDKCAATVQKTMGNEIIVMTVLFMGSLAGGILWVLAMMMMRKGVGEREARRMERQNRFHLQKMLTAEKVKAYDKYVDAVMDAVDSLEHKKTVTGENLKSFREGSVFINLHGSKHLRAMDEHIGSLIQTGKSLALADKFHLKAELSKIMKADLA